MTSPRFIVLIPTHAHATLLPFSVRSVQSQTRDDLELVIVGDGVGDDTRDVVADLCRGDDRIRFVDRPKSPRTGEPYRHEVLQASDAVVAAYLSDDDLFLPDHLEVVDAALQQVDLVHALGVRVSTTGGFEPEWSDLGVASQRSLELAGTSLVGLSGMAHTMAAYRRLPHGWRTTPAGRFTDHYMYEQFLSDPDCTVAALLALTTLKFPDSLRRDMSITERRSEIEHWADRIRDAAGRAVVKAEAMAYMYRSGVEQVEWARAAEAGLDETRRAADDLRQQLDAARDELAAARSDAVALGVEVDSLSADLQSATSDLDSTEAALSVAETELGAIRAELSAAIDARREIEATVTWRARNRVLRLLRR